MVFFLPGFYRFGITAGRALLRLIILSLVLGRISGDLPESTGAGCRTIVREGIDSPFGGSNIFIEGDE